jgi:hypothetical protein
MGSLAFLVIQIKIGIYVGFSLRNQPKSPTKFLFFSSFPAVSWDSNRGLGHVSASLRFIRTGEDPDPF